MVSLWSSLPNYVVHACSVKSVEINCYFFFSLAVGIINMVVPELETEVNLDEVY